MATKTMITLRLFHIVVDDGDGDDGNDDGIDIPRIVVMIIIT